MKATSMVLVGLLALATLPNALADEWLPAKKGAAFAGATAAGAALGGPLGLLGGGLLAVWLHDTLDEAAEADTARVALASVESELAASETALAETAAELASAREANAQYAQLVLDRLQLEMLFKTNETHQYRPDAACGIGGVSGGQPTDRNQVGRVCRSPRRRKLQRATVPGPGRSRRAPARRVRGRSPANRKLQPWRQTLGCR